MKKYISGFFLVALLINSACSDGQTSGNNLSAIDFSEKIKQLHDELIVDVRTPEEFSNGHLINAINIDWNGNDFDQKISKFDKLKPLFVYCLSGGRSSSAASKMRDDGFKVYELKGGIMKWRAANLPETTNPTSISNGMTKKQFDDLFNSEKLFLIDFYADWCAPCKKMKPYLDEISNEMKDKVQVIRINADDNQALCKELTIDALPVLQVYKNKTLIWTNTGYIEKAGVLKVLD